MPAKPAPDINAFLARWSGGDGGQERANYALFLAELCDVLGVPRPDQASHDATTNAYAFERAVTFREPDGSTSSGRIDLYKRGSFVLEAKQSRRPGAAKAMPEQGDLLSAEDTGDRAARQAHRLARLGRADDERAPAGGRLRQGAARCPKAGRPSSSSATSAIALRFTPTFRGQGKNYAQFPDRQGFRIYLEDLRDDEIRERLRLIWLDPHKLDPTKIAAKATREVARTAGQRLQTSRRGQGQGRQDALRPGSRRAVSHALPVHDVRRRRRAFAQGQFSRRAEKMRRQPDRCSRASSGNCGRRWTPAAFPSRSNAT